MNIIIVSYIGSPWLQDCLESLRECKYPIYVAMNTKASNWYETAGFELAEDMDNDFVIMHDSMIIKDLKVFDMMKEHPGPVSFAKDFLMYFGKYESGYDYPRAKTKEEAVAIELGFCKQYAQRTNAKVLFPEFTDTNVFEEKHGKKRMVLENQYVKKWKNCWHTSMISEADKVQ